MEPSELFKKSEETEPTGKPAGAGDVTKPEETKEETKVDQEEDFEIKSVRLAKAVEDARDGMDLGDIPARDDHPYHLALAEHRLHESKRKK